MSDETPWSATASLVPFYKTRWHQLCWYSRVELTQLYINHSRTAISIIICLEESTVNLAIIVRPSSKDTASLMHGKVHRASPHIGITLHQRRIRLSIVRLAKVAHSLAVIRPPAHEAHDAVTTVGKFQIAEALAWSEVRGGLGIAATAVAVIVDVHADGVEFVAGAGFGSALL